MATIFGILEDDASILAKFVAVELASRLAGMTGRAVGAHYAAIRSAAVSIIRRNVRQRKYDVAQAVQTLLTKIRNDEARSAKLNI